MSGNYAGRCGSCRFFARLEKNGKVHQSGHCEVGKRKYKQASDRACKKHYQEESMERSELATEEIKEDAAKEDNDMIVRRFVAMVGHDYYIHHKRKEEEHIAQIHPDFSEDTRIFWHEIESRLKEPTTLNFDISSCIKKLEKMALDQSEMCKRADYSSSYHYGLKTAYWDAIRIIRDFTKPTEEKE